MRLIKLIEMPGKKEFYLAASQIRAVIADPANPMVCTVMTNLWTGQQFEAISILGSAESIAHEVNLALSGLTADQSAGFRRQIEA